MKKHLSYFVASVAFFASCQNQQGESNTIDTASTTIVADTVVAPDTVLQNDKLVSSKVMDKDTSKLPDISGMHNLTLQWISWDNPGKIKFTKTDEPNVYKISGEQKSAALGYVKVDGIAKMISPLQLEFDGTIAVNLSRNPTKETECTKVGKQTFLSTKNRKYWRLQNMQSCYNNGTIDYVDIYF